MYHPKTGGHEFVEIENLTSTPFDIALWRLSGGVDFEFPDFSSASARNTFLKALRKLLYAIQIQERSEPFMDYLPQCECLDLGKAT